ncbi:DUF3592 domain-containing protein [Mariniblastus fucicola]|uniref:DUF3592 domain-containing protein n=1 Tax=Mariniblastus fucicola TaxID=980251 RepID=A0A5B9PGS3_9BACT|nr:DUF3592 domain-containing protein [Mariniblastus fucicola]QEG21953.1 hypothetical protein MFFC18_18140 [Mariniblastus fucicola]
MFQWIVVAVAALFLLAGLSLFSQLYPNLVACWQAADWPTAVGVVNSSDVLESSTSKGTPTYMATVDYTYSVAGRSFNGYTIAHGFESTKNRETHAAIVNILQESTIVAVRYNPESPQDSTLSYGLHRSMIISLTFLALWFIVVPLISAAIIMDSSFDRKLIENISLAVKSAAG